MARRLVGRLLVGLRRLGLGSWLVGMGSRLGMGLVESLLGLVALLVQPGLVLRQSAVCIRQSLTWN
jgi:hypothetical protein